MHLKRPLFETRTDDKNLSFPKLFETYFLKTMAVLDELEKTTEPVTLHLHAGTDTQKPTTPKAFVMFLCEAAIRERAKKRPGLDVVVVR